MKFFYGLALGIKKRKTMGFRLAVIFITNQDAVSNEELLGKLGFEDKEKWNKTDFYGTSKQSDLIFVGTKNKCKIIANGTLANNAFLAGNPLLSLKGSEIASLIWNETSSIYGFCLIKNGEIIRSVLSVDDVEIEDGFGEPIEEENEIKEDQLFQPDEIEEILEHEGEAYLKNLIKSEIICRATNNLAKRFIGAGLVEIQDHIEMIKYS